MTQRSRPFARVYYEDLMEDYPAVYFHPSALATYVRLLVLQEQTYPSDPTLPKGVKRSDLALLMESPRPGEDGLVVVVNGHGQYRIKGYKADRERRAQAGRKGAAGRWGQDG